MICRKCSNEFDDALDFCPVCGEPKEVYTQQPPVYIPAPAALTDEEKRDKKDSVIIWSLLSLVFAVCGPYVVDLIFAIIAGKKIKEYLNNVESKITESINACKVMQVVALVLSIVKLVTFVIFIVIYVLYFVILFMAILGESTMFSDLMYY